MIGNSNTIQIEIRLGKDGAITGFRQIGDESERSGRKVDSSFGRSGRTLALFNRNVLDLAAGFTIGNVAMQAYYETLRLIRQEITLGLGAAEDLNLKVASMTAFITTFSQRSKDGDIAGAFREANEYAQALVPRLEILDAKTVATGRDLQTIAETMAMNGVVLDINNKKQEQGFINIANALKLVTAGQNSDIQLRQEINALLLGQVRMTDRLPKLLTVIDRNLEKHLEQWKQEGTLIENVGELLKGFSASTDLISATWAAIGTTMETIHTRILRGGMLPVYEDLLDLVSSVNQSLMDQDGNLTPIAQKVQGVIAVGWLDIKNLVESIANIIGTFEGPLTLVGRIVGAISDGWGMILAILPPILNIVKLFGQAMWKNIEMIWKGLSFDFAGAKLAFQEGGRLVGAAMATDLRAEFERRLADYFDAKNIGGNAGVKAPPPAPVLAPGMSENQLKEIEKAAEIREKIGRDLLDEIKRQTLDEYDYKKWALDREIADLYAKAGEEKAIQDSIAQYRMLKALEVEKGRATDDRKLLSDRLVEWEKFYTDLRRKIDDHAAAEKKHIEELNRLYEQQRDIRKTTEEMLAGLRGKTIDPAERYRTTRQDLDQEYFRAMQLSGQQQVDALEKYKKAVHDLAQEFSAGVGALSGRDVVGQAISDIQRAYQVQQWAMSELSAAAERQAEADRRWGEELQATAVESADRIEELRQTITDLDAQIKAMDKLVQITGQDLVSPVVAQIQAELNSLHDKTITITTLFRSEGGGDGTVAVPVLDSYAKGTDYVPADGPYWLHRGESVTPAAENNRAQGGGMVIQGDINIILPESIAAAKPEDWDWRRIARENLIPALREVGGA